MCSSDLLRAENADLRRALAAQEARFAALMENGLEAIWLIGPDGRVQYATPSTQRIIGYDAARVEGSLASDWILPEDRELVGRETAAIIEDPSRSRVLECRIRRPDGSVRWMECTGSFLREGPMAGALVSNFRDITAHKEAQAALAVSQRELQQAQKMEALGTLAGGVAHDFNNMLSVILSYSSLILDDLGPSDSIRADIEEIQKAAHRATAITGKLLALSRRQVLEPVCLDIDEVVAALRPTLQTLLGKQTQLRVVAAATDGAVFADRTQLDDALVSLVVRGRDAMARAGTLTLETANVNVQDAHGSVPPGAYVTLAVTDEGLGLDAATKERIFEPFYTTDGKGKGAGLGLSTAYAIVQQSGGHVTVDSAPGLGTTFTVYLPKRERR